MRVRLFLLGLALVGCDFLEARSLVVVKLSAAPELPTIGKVAVSVHEQTREESGEVPVEGAGSLALGVYLERDTAGLVPLRVLAYDGQGKVLARHTEQIEVSAGRTVTKELVVRKECMDACPGAGAGKCASSSSSATCGDFNEDGCVEWGSSMVCAERCRNDRCVTCTDACTDGAVRCDATGSKLELCADHDQNGCYEWGRPTACPYGCAASKCRDCRDECTAGATRCSADGKRETCANHDSDACTEWGGLMACPLGCANGQCVCSDECSAGARRCNAAGTGSESCGNFDVDTCLDWGGVVVCGTGCDPGTGLCRPLRTFPATCTRNGECTEGCSEGGWCIKACTASAQCPGGWCVQNTKNVSVCFPRCTAASQCLAYSNVTCKTSTAVEGTAASVCAR